MDMAAIRRILFHGLFNVRLTQYQTFTVDGLTSALDTSCLAGYHFYVYGITGMNLMHEQETVGVHVNVRIVPFGVAQIQIGGFATRSPEPVIAIQEQQVLRELPHTTGTVIGLIWTKNSATLAF